MGEAGNSQVYVDLDEALEQENLAFAWQGAWEQGHVRLYQALRLTVLMGVQEDPSFRAACNRLLIRFIREVKPSLELTGELIAALKELDSFAVHPAGEGPEYELKKLAKAIEQAHRERKVPRLTRIRR